MVSSKTAGDLKGLLGLTSITCVWSSFPKVNLGCWTELTTRPYASLSILSTMGRALSSLSTTANSCSGPKTSSVSYVQTPPAFCCASKIEYKHTVNLKYVSRNTELYSYLVSHGCWLSLTSTSRQACLLYNPLNFSFHLSKFLLSTSTT